MKYPDLCSFTTGKNCFGGTMKKYILAVLSLIMTCSVANAQHSNAIQIHSPAPNEEICLASSIPISASFKNNDTISRTIIARFVIRNIVTNIADYFNADTLRNISPGASIDTIFTPYITNPNILNQLGSFLACASIVALDSAGYPITDWTFADSSCVRIFGIRTTALPFNEPSDGYSKTLKSDIPDQTKWVSLGATIVDGNLETWDPPPPRYDDSSGGVGPDGLLDPVIRLDRSDANNKLYDGSGVGDTLISFPFNLLGQTKCILAFDFMRGGRNLYPDLWDSQMMLGPEQTVLNKNGEVLRSGDSLILEFKDTSESSCNPNLWNRIAAIDGGLDAEFQSCLVKLNVASATLKITGKAPDTIAFSQNYFNSKFRYRLRLKANNNADGTSSTKDDDDPWYIDNISLQVPRRPEIEVRWVRVVTPYTKIPFSAASALPVYFSVRNNETDVAIGFPVNVLILDSKGDTAYFQTISVHSLRGGADTVVRLPDWNAQHFVTDKFPITFTVNAALASSSYDNYTQDNGTFSTFYLNCDVSANAIQEFAYDDGINDIPAITRIVNAGIGFSNSSGSYAMKFTLPHSDTVFGGRIYFTDASGSPDGIRISLFKDDPINCTPGEIFKRADGSDVMLTDVRRGNLFNQFWPYYFPTPAVVPAGSYWLVISQLGLNNFQMGGNVSRGGGSITVADSIAPHISPIYSSPYGTQWSPTKNNGDVSCAYAIETPAASGNWKKWMPESGWWPTNFSGTGNQQVTWNPNIAPPFNRGGSFLPLMRVMVGSVSTPYNKITVNKRRDFGFDEIYPNPITSASASVELHFILSEDGLATLIIYDEMGREVRRLIRSTFEKGKHVERWDGRDANGSTLSQGIYFCRLTERGKSASAKLIIVK